MYIFIVLVSALFLGTYEVLKKVSLKKSSVLEVLFFYCLSAFVFSMIFIKCAFSMSLIDILFILMKSGVVVINWYLVLKCMKKLDVAIVVSFSLVNTILVVFGSSLIFKEEITWIHFLSLLFIGCGVFLISLLDEKSNEDKEKKNHYEYLLLLILASCLGAVSSLLDKYMLTTRNMESNGILVWFLFFNSLIYGIIYFVKNKKVEWRKLKDNYFVVLTGAAIAIADITYYFSITLDGAQLSLISILRKCSVVVATIFASLFLKEKNLLKKLGILLIMLVGVSLPIIFR